MVIRQRLTFFAILPIVAVAFSPSAFAQDKGAYAAGINYPPAGPWTSLSPWRLYLEFPEWIAALWVLTALHPK